MTNQTSSQHGDDDRRYRRYITRLVVTLRTPRSSPLTTDVGLESDSVLELDATPNLKDSDSDLDLVDSTTSLPRTYPSGLDVLS